MRIYLKFLALALCFSLTACAPRSSSRWDMADSQEEALSWSEGCEDPRTLVLLCEEDVCRFYRCQGLVHAPAQIVPARGVGSAAPPGATGAAIRWWGNVQQLPGDSEPVFIIPWRNPQRLLPLPSEQQWLAQAEEIARRPHERHHIFPQEQELREWFTLKGINIHEATLLLEVDLHRRIHDGPRGGPWNAAWRRFKSEHPEATREQVWLHAGELNFRFELFGPVLPYYTPRPGLRL